MGVLHLFPQTRPQTLAMALLQRHSAKEIADAIEVLIDVLDALGGDPDLEDNGDTEPNGDERDISAPEWHTRHFRHQKAGYEMAHTGNGIFGATEDDEDDDPAGQCDEDGINTALHVLTGRGAGCIIADVDCDEGGKFPTYGIDQTVPLGLSYGIGVDPVPAF